MKQPPRPFARAVVGLLALPASLVLGLAASLGGATALLERGAASLRLSLAMFDGPEPAHPSESSRF